MKILLICFLSAFVISLCEGKKDCMSVRGTVKCGSGRPGAVTGQPIFIKLIDEDTGGPDDWMDETYASANGAFQLYGCATDRPLGGHIEPMIRVFHKCKATPKKFTVTLPVEFVGKEYNMTTVYDLSGPLQNEVDERYPVPPCGKKGKFYLF